MKNKKLSALLLAASMLAALVVPVHAETGTATAPVDRKILSGNGYGRYAGGNKIVEGLYKQLGYNAKVYPHLATYHYETYYDDGLISCSDTLQELYVTMPWVESTSEKDAEKTSYDEEGNKVITYYATPKLTDGRVNESSTSETVHTEEWGHPSVSVVMDLGQVMSVSGVDVLSKRIGHYACISSIKVEVSEDGTVWSTALNETDVSKAAGNLISHPNNGDISIAMVNFAAQDTRYVKVSATGTGGQLVLGEILVVGEVEFPVTATTPVFVNAEGGEYTDTVDPVGLYAKTTFSNTEGTLIVAWYDKYDALKKVYIGTGEGDVSINMSDDEKAFLDSTGDKMKAFAFESLADASILADVAILQFK